ncbi:hypothetical protein LPTSP3_g31470 [Leptospira kobayashii]|uniref:Uncharacterized protein n=1 Tax=Leptospira kobayashii TaxID=1917830 RepID=A0ABM7UMD5_9LEPT|nr:hypothetical protein [Leptospira kobayashii]BDA80217.1 hypothetical protein LPTSP3_g31470 [Leptospira kobayashii]
MIYEIKNCPFCFNALIFSNDLENNQIAECLQCRKKYPIIEDTKYAEAWTGNSTFIHFSEKEEYKIYYTENLTIDMLESAFNDLEKLDPKERRPYKLIPILKLIHDSLKERFREKIAYHSFSKLPNKEKQTVALDPPGKNLNIEKIIYEILPSAFSHLSEKTKQLILASQLDIKQIRFIRNKSEHLILNKWTIPSFVHTELNKLPSEYSSIPFNHQWVKKMMNTSSKILESFLLDFGYEQKNLSVFKKYQI